MADNNLLNGQQPVTLEDIKQMELPIDNQIDMTEYLKNLEEQQSQQVTMDEYVKNIDKPKSTYEPGPNQDLIEELQEKYLEGEIDAGEYQRQLEYIDKSKPTEPYIRPEPKIKPEPTVENNIEDLQEQYLNGEISDKEYSEMVNNTLNDSTLKQKEQSSKEQAMEELQDKFENGKISAEEYQRKLEYIKNNSSLESNPDVLENERIRRDYSRKNSNNHYRDDIEYKKIERNGKVYNIDRGQVRNIDFLDKDGNILDNSRVVYNDEYVPVSMANKEGHQILDREAFEDIIDIRREQVHNMSNTDWEKAELNKDMFGFHENQNILDERIKVTDAKLTSATKEHKNLLEKDKLTKADKKRIKELEELKVKHEKKLISLKYRKNLREGANPKAKAEYKASQKEILEEFKSKTENLNPKSKEFKKAKAEMRSKMGGLKDTEFGRFKTREKVNAQNSIASVTNKMLSPMKIINTAFAAKQGIDRYKKEREEGHGVISSTIAAAGDVFISNAVGITGFLAIDIAKELPKAAVKGTSFLYQKTREMNSVSSFAPLGGVHYQDNQQLATMRQSGMELAKMSQYNLEQTLMGAEARHLHR